MRVSKTVREYIVKQVGAKMDKKYAALMEQEKATKEAIDQLNNSVLTAVVDLAETMFAEGVAGNPAIQRTEDDIRFALRYSFSNIIAPVPNPKGSAYQQRRKEVETIAQNIIVNLELGGTKADLERMLEEIAVED